MKTFFASLFCLLLLLPNTALAQDFTTQLENAGGEVFASSDSGDLIVMIGFLIRTVMSLLGIVLLVIVVYAGFLWMTAGGNSERVKDAQQYMLNGVIGLVILLFSYVIANFVLELLTSAGSEAVAFL